MRTPSWAQRGSARLPVNQERMSRHGSQSPPTRLSGSGPAARSAFLLSCGPYPMLMAHLASAPRPTPPISPPHYQDAASPTPLRYPQLPPPSSPRSASAPARLRPQTRPRSSTPGTTAPAPRPTRTNFAEQPRLSPRNSLTQLNAIFDKRGEVRSVKAHARRRPPVLLQVWRLMAMVGKGRSKAGSSGYGWGSYHRIFSVPRKRV